MEPATRHQCLLYRGTPSRHLAAVAEALRQHLDRNYRCLYLNSAPMVAAMRFCLAAVGVDVDQRARTGALILTSDQSHLDDSRFDVERMITRLESALAAALNAGYAGLFATGDMSWEFGPDKDFSRLLDYEASLEALFRLHPELSGICQYCADTMPREALREGLVSHQTLFLNPAVSKINTYYIDDKDMRSAGSATRPDLETFLSAAR